jgi:hypothetical protein
LSTVRPDARQGRRVAAYQNLQDLPLDLPHGEFGLAVLPGLAAYGHGLRSG